MSLLFSFAVSRAVLVRGGMWLAAVCAPAMLAAEVPMMKPVIEIESRFFDIRKTALAGSEAPELQWLKRLLPGPEPAPEAATGGVIDVLTPVMATTLTQALNELSGVDLVSAPKVTTRSGQRAMIEVTREFRYATDWDRPEKVGAGWTPKAFETRNTGVMLEVAPQLGMDHRKIDLLLTPQVVEFLGFIDFVTRQPVVPKVEPDAVANKLAPDAGAVAQKPEAAPEAATSQRQVPIFSARKVATLVSILDGQTAVLTARETEADGPFKSKDEDRLLLVLVTARLIPPAAPPVAPPPMVGDGADPGKVREPGTAIPVVTKPGFVQSPYAPDAGFVDVRGFPPRTQVKCPYTGKLFLVP